LTAAKHMGLMEHHAGFNEKIESFIDRHAALRVSA
jgi:hypothetical protein